MCAERSRGCLRHRGGCCSVGSRAAREGTLAERMRGQFVMLGVVGVPTGDRVRWVVRLTAALLAAALLVGMAVPAEAQLGSEPQPTVAVDDVVVLATQSLRLGATRWWSRASWR